MYEADGCPDMMHPTDGYTYATDGYTHVVSIVLGEAIRKVSGDLERFVFFFLSRVWYCLYSVYDNDDVQRLCSVLSGLECYY